MERAHLCLGEAVTRDPEQDTADLRRDVRRLVESATAEQLKAMRDACGEFRRATPPEPIDLPPETSRTDSRQLQPGQRVTIPARYLGDGCHGVRIGTAHGPMAFGCVPVEVPGLDGLLLVPVNEVEPA